MAQPKYGGRDCELSTTGVNSRGDPVDSWAITYEVLSRVTPALGELGVRVWSQRFAQHGYSTGYASPFSMDCLRHWTSAGQCYYSDMGHVEVCTASCLFPAKFAAQCVSTLLAAEAARKRAESESDADDRYSLAASNVDMLDPAVSFGSHLSLAVTASLWEDLFVEQRHPAILGYVSSAIAAAIAFFGVGYLMPLKDGTSVYSLSARAHHLSKIKTLSTTEAFSRGILNTRREPHGNDHERLHLIGFDYCMLSSALLFSFLQCVLAAAEEGYCGLILFDPVRSLRTWSWHMEPRTGKLPATASLIDGRRLALPAYIRELSKTFLQMCEAGLITSEVAPQASEMLPRIIELSHYAEEGSVSRCARNLTWAAKLLWLTELCSNGAKMGDAQTRLADHDFTSTNPDQGPLWRLWREGLVDPLVELSDAEACLREGPSESRDWGRGQIIKRFARNVSDINWSSIDFRSNRGRWRPRQRIEMPHLDSLNKEQFASVIHNATDPRHLCELLAGRSERNAQQTHPLDDVTRQLATLPDHRPSGSDGDSPD